MVKVMKQKVCKQCGKNLKRTLLRSVALQCLECGELVHKRCGAALAGCGGEE